MRRSSTIPTLRAIGVIGAAGAALASLACDGRPTTTAPAATGQAASEVEGTFEGSWNAAGSRRSLALGEGRAASVIDLRGSMLLTGPGRPGVGFRAEVIALTDTATGMVGRAVWTDQRGEQVFSDLTGEGTKERNRITGTITGGTGRFRGATGTYEFSWEYVIEAEDGAIQGRATGLTGRYRLALPPAATGGGGSSGGSSGGASGGDR